MGKIKELQARGVSDLMSYNLGRQDEQEHIIKLLENFSAGSQTIEELIVLIKGETE